MLQAAAEAVVEVVCGAIGHGLLWALTLGRWKAFPGSDDLTALVGLLFWAGIVVGLVWLLAR